MLFVLVLAVIAFFFDVRIAVAILVITAIGYFLTKMGK